MPSNLRARDWNQSQGKVSSQQIPQLARVFPPGEKRKSPQSTCARSKIANQGRKKKSNYKVQVRWSVKSYPQCTCHWKRLRKVISDYLIRGLSLSLESVGKGSRSRAGAGSDGNGLPPTTSSKIGFVIWGRPESAAAVPSCFRSQLGQRHPRPVGLWLTY